MPARSSAGLHPVASGCYGTRMAASCPICRRAVAKRSENPSHPFCSPACKLVDLGHWLDGRYRIAGPEGATEADDTTASLRRSNPNQEDE